MGGEPYHDKQKLREAYEELGKQSAVANKFDCARSTISKWLNEFDIDTYVDQSGPKITVECSNCGSPIEKIPSLANSRENHFCDYDCHAEWMGENQVGEDNPNWKEPAEMDCEWCGESFQFEEKYESERRFCSLDCSNQWKSSSMQGEDHHNWTGGSHYWYYGSNWEEKKQEVHERDTVCRVCGHDGSKRRLEVHHITPIRTFEIPENGNTLENLILLCSYCHGEVESGKQEHPDI